MFLAPRLAVLAVRKGVGVISSGGIVHIGQSGTMRFAVLVHGRRQNRMESLPPPQAFVFGTLRTTTEGRGGVGLGARCCVLLKKRRDLSPGAEKGDKRGCGFVHGLTRSASPFLPTFFVHPISKFAYILLRALRHVWKAFCWFSHVFRVDALRMIFLLPPLCFSISFFIFKFPIPLSLPSCLCS